MKDKKQTLTVVLVSAIMALIVTVIFNGVASMTGASVAGQDWGVIQKQMDSIEQKVDQAVAAIQEIVEKVDEMEEKYKIIYPSSEFDTKLINCRCYCNCPDGTSKFIGDVPGVSSGGCNYACGHYQSSCNNLCKPDNGKITSEEV